MKLLHFLRQESTVSLRRLAILAGIAGASNAMVLAIINVAVEHATRDAHSFQHLSLFTIALALYFITQKALMLGSTAEIEEILNKIRIRLADKIRCADLQPLEKIGRSEIYASVNRETVNISQAAATIVLGCQSAILVFFAVIYIAILSRVALLLFVLVSAIAVTVYLRRAAELNRELHETMVRENKFFEALTHMLDGFKEVKLNPERGADLFRHIQRVSDSATALKIKTQTGLSRQFVFSQAMYYVLVATMVFLVPRLSATYDEVIVKATTAMLFLIGPISNLVGAVPIFANASAAIENIYALEELLDESIDHPTVVQRSKTMTFQEIRFEGVSYRFSDPRAATSFAVGPIDLSIHQGETLFITGGNGSGKSTFLKLLTALYYPQKGIIRIDGNGLVEEHFDAYRRLFSAIFSDYHLFDRLYGLPDVDPDRVATLLEMMQLSKKTRYADGEFSTLDLSTGQKKRLALVVSLLEDRPIYIFDEWAAEQDPVFRQRFYEEVLQHLKEKGKTVIAVTHDDRYYHHADRVLKMDEGRFVDFE